MAKEVSSLDSQEAVVHGRSVEPSYRPARTDTKTVVVAVGASLVLFIIGLILGYLLGHQTATNDRGTFPGGSSMMNSGNFRNQSQSTTN